MRVWCRRSIVTFAVISLLLFSSETFCFRYSVRRSTWSHPQSLSFSLFNSAIDTAWTPRIQRIKDLSLQKDILRDITAGEFALRVEANQRNKDQIIDFERLIDTLDKDLLQLQRRPSSTTVDKQVLIPRINAIKEDLILASNNMPLKHTDLSVAMPQSAMENICDPNDESCDIQDSLGNKIATSSSSIGGKGNEDVAEDDEEDPLSLKKVKDIRNSLRILVREDGTVDWDGALASGREAAKFGSELWERLNGREAEEEGPMSLADFFSPAQEKKLPESPEIERMNRVVEGAKLEVYSLRKHRDQLKFQLRKDKRRDGSIPSKESIRTLKQLEERVKDMEKRLKLLTLNLDMERICAYVQREVESSTLDATEQRTLIAEVSLVDKQLSGIMAGMPGNFDETATIATSTSTRTNVSNGVVVANNYNNNNNSDGSEGGENGSVDSADTSASLAAVDDKILDFLELVDEAELGFLYATVSDLKSRLGLDTQLIPKFDWGSLGVVTTENLNKIKMGLSFFGEGTSCLVSDVQYAYLMLEKAASGKTLKPREVNAVRRTGKDLLTLIPFTIILIIPLSPVGHVLVFTFIQRFFPEFYPSCYTDKRLNLRRLFQEVELKGDEADLLIGDSNDEGGLNLLSWEKFQTWTSEVLGVDAMDMETWKKSANINDDASSITSVVNKFFMKSEITTTTSNSASASSSSTTSDKNE